MESRKSVNQIVQEVHREFAEAGRLTLNTDDDHAFWDEVERRWIAAGYREPTPKTQTEPSKSGGR